VCHVLNPSPATPGAAAKNGAPHAKKEAATATSELRTSALFRQRPEAARPGRAAPGYAEIKTILGRTLVFHFTFPLGKGLLCRGLPPSRATAFNILKLAGSSMRLPGPLPRRFRRTIFFDRCFMRSFP
jgi:hypothetical protein